MDKDIELCVSLDERYLPILLRGVRRVLRSEMAAISTGRMSYEGESEAFERIKAFQCLQDSINAAMHQDE